MRTILIYFILMFCVTRVVHAATEKQLDKAIVQAKVDYYIAVAEQDEVAIAEAEQASLTAKEDLYLLRHPLPIIVKRVLTAEEIEYNVLRDKVNAENITTSEIIKYLKLQMKY